MKQRKPAPAMYQPKAEREKETEIKLDLKPCENPACKKVIEAGYYAHWNDGGVCGRACNDVMTDLRKAWYASQGGGTSGESGG